MSKSYLHAGVALAVAWSGAKAQMYGFYLNMTPSTMDAYMPSQISNLSPGDVVRDNEKGSHAIVAPFFVSEVA
ncbi:MAG: hypothetical protein EOO38_24135 [Cytophagaceae bacterium]|nr:MAG: hypothetical protein EOO38_24135 [Cytophagaceae bacterium]